MTVTVTDILAGPFYPNGVTTAFPFSFKIPSAEEVRVFSYADGVEAVLDPGLYSVAISADAEGGSINFTLPPSSALAPLFIEADPLFTQQANFNNNGFLPRTINPQLDRGAIRDLILREKVDRSILFPRGESGVMLPEAAARKSGKVLGFNAITGAFEVQGAGAFKGDPGGNTMAIGLFAIASTLSIPLGTDLVQTSGSVVRGMGFARYAYDDAVDAAYVASHPLSSFISANGRGFKIAENAVDPVMFGALGDGSNDDTPAFQAAQDTGLPVVWSIPPVQWKLTDTLKIDPGANIRGVGGTANFNASPCKIYFDPPTKRDLFNWRVAPDPDSYVFGGTQISGFCVQGGGPGIACCVDLPLLYNGRIDFYAFGGFDCWIKTRRWQDCRVFGGAQGFRTYGIHFDKAGSDDVASDVTTTFQVLAYIGHGPIAYYASERATTDTKVMKGSVIESVDNATDIARGNVMTFDVYTENVPRTFNGTAWKYGKTGTAFFWETALTVNLQPGVGHTVFPNLATLFDVDHVRLLKISGYAYLYRALLKTTENTFRVIIDGLDTAQIELFSQEGGIANYNAIEIPSITPNQMLLTPSSADAFTSPNVTSRFRMWSQDRGAVPADHLFLDATLNNKLVYRDRFGNFTAPIGALRVSGISGWTVQGGRLSPGELVQNMDPLAFGQPGLWLSTRHSKDVPNIYTGCTTTAGSPIVTNPTIGTFFKCEIGDYVVLSSGYPDVVTQHRVIDRTPDLTQITLDSPAVATVAAAVAVETEAHKLVPLAQQAHREVDVDPVGAVVPNFKGEELFRTDTSNWYKSTGLTIADWKLITA